jgi:hypothetical protein
MAAQQSQAWPLLDRLRTAAEDVRWAASLVAAQQHTTIDDLWAPHHQLAHLLAVETENFQPRIKRIIAEDRPVLERWDTDGFNHRYQPVGDITALAEQFVTERMNTVALFATLSPEQRQRTGTWPDGVVVDLAWLAEKALWHSLDHYAQLLDLHGEFETLQAER